MAAIAVADSWITGESLAMADTVILLAVISLAIAPTTFCLLQVLNLLLAFGLSLRSIVVETSCALTHSWVALDALLQAHAVELATLSALTIAALDRSD